MLGGGFVGRAKLAECSMSSVWGRLDAEAAIDVCSRDCKEAEAAPEPYDSVSSLLRACEFN